MNGVEKEPTTETETSVVASTDKPNLELEKTIWSNDKIKWLKYVAFLSFVTRFIYLHFPPSVVFDEHHHIKFISWYVKREYYLDVHPPLGRLIFAIVAEAFGYDGKFDVDKPGSTFIGSTFPLFAVRSVSASLSVLTSVLVYSILVEMKFSLQSCIICAMMVIFDNSVTIAGRIFVLEAQLVCYMILTCYCWVKFRSYHSSAFSKNWWKWLMATGIGIGLTLGVKYVGLFIMLVIGVCTVCDLWDVSNVKKNPSDLEVFKHWLARSLCLILVPMVLFISFYWVHFQFSYKSGTGDQYMSAEFQSTLEGNKVTNATFPVFYGSTIRIKSNVEAVYLHSHEHRYPFTYGNNKVSSQGQQVTGYGHKDGNNEWMILPADTYYNLTIQNFTGQRIPVTNGDLIRLMHLPTKRFLLSHNVASPLTMTNQEVTAVDWNGTDVNGNTNKTVWRLEIAQSIADSSLDPEVLTAKIHLFRLVHNESECVLINHQVNLPEWAYGQREINAAKNHLASSVWSIDDVVPSDGWSEEEIEEVRRVDYLGHKRPSFLAKLIELVIASLEFNSKLIDANSSPWEPFKWPVMMKGMHFWFSKEGNARIYFMGNPFTWAMSLLSLFTFVAIIVVDLFAGLRGRTFLSRQQKSFIYPKGCFFLLCYLFHFLPFFFMGRILYFHHYLPSYVFSTMIFASTYQVLFMFFPYLGRKSVVGFILVGTIGTFWKFSGLIYGGEYPKEYYQSLKLRSGWDFI